MDSKREGNAELRSGIRKQEVVAELGQRALETDDLDQLLHDATVAVAETLDTEYCHVLELLPADELVLRQGVGWKEGVVGEATVPAERDSHATYTLRSEAPIIVDDLRTEDRFTGNDLLVDHDIVSGITVLIGTIETPWGVLGTFTSDHREYTEHDATFVQSVGNILAAVVENKRTESELEKSYGRISDAFFALDEEWRFTHLNEQAHSVINPEGRTLVGADIWEEFPAVVEHEFKPKFEHAMYDQETVSFEEYYPEPLDSWLEVRAYPSETGLSVYFRDISERKEYERSLERSEQRYRTLVENFPDGVVALVDEDLHYVKFGGTLEGNADRTRADLDGAPLRDVLPKELANVVIPHYEAALDGETSKFESTIDGLVYQFHFIPVRDDDGDIFAAMCVSQDITERKEREHELEQFETVAETVSDVIVVIDEQSEIQTVNPAVAAVFGYDPDELIGESITVLMPDSLRERHFDSLRQYLETGERHLDWEFIELPGLHKDGHEIPLAISFSEYEYEDDRFFTGIIRDNTERKQLEARLTETVDKLRESNERLEQFAYAVSHDLQEPLRMVSSYLQLLEDRYVDDLDDDAGAFIEFAVDGAERMKAMIDGLLQYSRVDTEGDPLVAVDLDEVCDDARTDLHVRIEETGAEITAEELPTVMGDDNQLRQVFQNLLSNAIEYSGDEPPRVHVSAERDGPEWCISVRDEGLGIDPGDADRVFEVFRRLHPQDEHTGTGIGLALCKRIVERHGGDIWVKSAPGEGSTFTFTLPAASGSDT